MTGTVPIEEKISVACEIAPRIYQLFKRDALLERVEKVKEMALKSKAMMDELGVTRLCTQCALAGDGAGCCSKKIEDWYEVPTIVLNLLLGVSLPTGRRHENSCIFLGENGCTLIVRYHFCVNYLCKKIEQSLGQEALSLMKAQYGSELFAVWELEKVIWRYFNMNL